MKMRGDICGMVNRLAAGYSATEHDVDVMVAYNLILDYCKNNKIHPKMVNVSMDGYMLVIDGKVAGRVVTPLKNPCKYAGDPEISRAEGRILRRQENFND